ncbi:hypothetical protein PHYSODRAFT_500421 [Phytophthora sojae]|uniref:HAT C-terminal dimerisation domain-containing protein n=1 Tax=Phytophthora sojae (strain P6497) TaxID=1094619 RepID=G4ZCP3_PHYSP|nr:hypothetical protein PHYSODRAFT_500421 [Phytophthora sojae]EGZ17775.1 hypothetical protein PHYSODRAFT_500421 [Phytophthora sojae]|eukprot:XP_009526833.1 hypothetical protein PHYSODRAFT_500421 [Phytophthora sojae]
MLQRCLDLQPAVKDFFLYIKSEEGEKEFNDRSTKKLKIPSAKQWFMIQCLVELLAPFSVATTMLDGETYPTLISLHLFISSLKRSLDNQQIFDVLYTSVEKEAYAMEVLSIMQSVRRSFSALLKQRFDKEADPDLLWISLLDHYMTNSAIFTADEYEKAREHEAEVKAPDKPPSALSWWKQNHSKFPTIAVLARKWLGCIATSVPLERAFSTAGNTVTKRRCSLKASTVRDIVFMAQNGAA